MTFVATRLGRVRFIVSRSLEIGAGAKRQIRYVSDLGRKLNVIVNPRLDLLYRQ
jgi:hypothetical protein